MAKQQRPLVRQINQPPSDPQVAFLVHRDAMERMPGEMANALQQFMGCSIFIDFCKINVALSEKAMSDLRPMADHTMEQYTNLSKDLRLVWRFWTDLLQFAEEFKQQ